MLQPSGCWSKPTLSSGIAPHCPVVPPCSPPEHPHGRRAQAVPRMPGQICTSEAERRIWSVARTGREERRTSARSGGVCASVRLQQETQHRGTGDKVLRSPLLRRGVRNLPGGRDLPAALCPRARGVSRELLPAAPAPPRPLPLQRSLGESSAGDPRRPPVPAASVAFCHAAPDGSGVTERLCSPSSRRPGRVRSKRLVPREQWGSPQPRGPAQPCRAETLQTHCTLGWRRGEGPLLPMHPGHHLPGTPLCLRPPLSSSPCSPGSLRCPGTMATGELTELETAIEKIVTVFFTYAGKEGKKGTLTASEFKELVQLQLPNLMKVRRGAARVGWLDPHGSPRAGGLLPTPWDLQARTSGSPCSPPSPSRLLGTGMRLSVPCPPRRTSPPWRRR